MKGIALARYWMIASLTMTAANCCAAFPQQPNSESSSTSASTSVDAPVQKFYPSPATQNSNWFSTLRDDAVTVPSHLFDDQKQIWTSPLRLRISDAEWLIPFAGITSAAIFTDPSFSKALPNSPHTLNTFSNVRLAGVSTLGAASGGLYLWSLHTHDPHQRETGLLAGEAIVDSLIVTQGLKLMVPRQRPLEGNGQGAFFQGGNSFPSEHSAAAWAAAGILAHEYHGTLTKLLVYGLASSVSIASVGSKQHFPSDVLIGTGLGWAISESVYHRRHNAELGGAAWNPLKSIFQDTESGPSKYPGSAYVPVDSWVYRAFDRLAALGYISSAYQGTRPWSRERCAHLLIDVDQALAKSSEPNAEAVALSEALRREFAREQATFAGPNQFLGLESVYSRVLSASGSVLTDGYHFGQTFAYDYGRPFLQGTNLIDGASASANYGTVFFYFDGEYQHSPGAPALSSDVRNFIAERDKGPVPSDAPFSPINQFAVLDAYAGVNLQGWQITFGNQSLSWGPGIGGSLLLSNNAAPFPMLRMTPENSLEIPGLSKVLGPFILDQFIGRLEGHGVPDQPWIYGQKISIKPFASWEFAYSRTTLIGGTGGDPVTSKTLLQSIFGRVNSTTGSVPGDSRTAIDWTWRVPHIHDWVTFYGEMEDDDDLIPLQNPAKSVWRPGLYFPRLPWLPKWDLHFEYTASTSPGRASFQNHGNLNYWNLQYPDGYTNEGDLMANTVGREGVSLQAWIRYWASPTHTLDLSWKQQIVLNDYVPGGGKWQDYQASYSVVKRSGLYFRGFFQFEHIFSYPLLFPGAKNNVTAALEVGFLPQWRRQSAVPAASQTAQTTPSSGSPNP